MKICTIGLGYIGLPTSIIFAQHGANVVAVDIKSEVVDSLNRGMIHIEEPGLQEALDEVREKGTFRATLKPEKADAFLIAVPTPNKNDTYKSCDLSAVIASLESIMPFVEKGNVLIIESTVAPRTMDDVVKPLVEAAGFVIGEDVFLVHCPERVLAGQILDELVGNNRIVGGMTPECAEAGAEVYRSFVKGEIIKTDAKTAEMAKLMENTYRDVNIALANELAKICNQLEINTLEVIRMANKHPRVQLHTPGPGVGGHCLAVDPYFIVAKAPEVAHLVEVSRAVNTSMPLYVVEQVNRLMHATDGKRVTIFGLTYKGNVDDTRESPAMEICRLLQKQKQFEIKAFDPHVREDWISKDIEQAVDGSDLILILADHKEFQTLTSNQLAKMNQKRIFDTKDIVQSVPDDVVYMNYGNLFEFLKKDAAEYDPYLASDQRATS